MGRAVFDREEPRAQGDHQTMATQVRSLPCSLFTVLLSTFSIYIHSDFLSNGQTKRNLQCVFSSSSLVFPPFFRVVLHRISATFPSCKLYVPEAPILSSCTMSLAFRP